MGVTCFLRYYNSGNTSNYRVAGNSLFSANVKVYEGKVLEEKENKKFVENVFENIDFTQSRNYLIVANGSSGSGKSHTLYAKNGILEKVVQILNDKITFDDFAGNIDIEVKEMLSTTSKELYKGPVTSSLNFKENVMNKVLTAMKSRKVASTKFNKSSSRMYVSTMIAIDGIIKDIPYAANFFIIDMAGSEGGTNMTDQSAINSSIFNFTEALRNIKPSNKNQVISSKDALVQYLKKYLNSDTEIAVIYTLCETTPSGTLTNGVSLLKKLGLIQTSAANIEGNFRRMKELMKSAIKPTRRGQEDLHEEEREPIYRAKCKVLTAKVNDISNKLRKKREIILQLTDENVALKQKVIDLERQIDEHFSTVD